MDDDPVERLSGDDCWALLRKTPMGRLAIGVVGEVDIFPVNYVVDGKTIVFRTAAGTKLVELTVAGTVAFEIDGVTETDAWSVVAKGPAARLERQSEIDAADLLPLEPWVPTLKYTYVRMTPTQLTGRRFQRGPEPDRYAL